jgi:alpha-1,6-mannosyltransferase
VRIVDVNEFYAEQGGGVRTYVNAKLRAAAERGHELVILAPGPEDKREARLGGEVIWLKSPPMPLDPRYFVLYRQAPVHRWLDQLRPDIIEGSSPWTSGWFAARYPGRAKRAFIYHQDPVAVYSHTLLDRLLSVGVLDAASAPYWAYTRRLAKHFDSTVVAGQWLAQRLRSHGIDNAVAVPFGIDRHLFSPEHAQPSMRAELLARCGLGPNARLLITISRHHPEKRVTTLIEAVGHLNRQGQEIGLVVFGDGPLRSWIERAARGVPQVHIAGFVADRPFIAGAVASADALIHGSAAETYGFVVAEALSSGTPVIVPERGGAFDFATPECSEVYRPGDANDCARAVTRLLQRNPAALRHASLLQARTHVGSQDDHFDRLFSLYATLLER